MQCPMKCGELAPLLAAPKVPVRCGGQGQCGLGEQLPWELVGLEQQAGDMTGEAPTARK